MGSHYGVRTRKQESAVLSMKNARYPCPKCGKKSLKRKGYALWICSSCDNQFAGGAYSPETEVGFTARQTITSLKKKKQ